MEQKEKFRQMVVEGFSTKKALKAYDSVRLFEAEEYCFSKYFRKGSSVLDVGCGAGRTSIALAKKGHKVVAIDISPALIALAKKNAKKTKAKIEFKAMDALKIGYRENSFDNVLYSLNLIEYIPTEEERRTALENAFKFCRKGGYFIMTTTNLLYFDKLGKSWAKLALNWAKFHSKKLLGIKTKELEFGDVFYADDRVGGILNFQHNSNPFHIKNSLREAGFEVIEFFPEQWLLKEKKPDFLANFAKSRLYYVARKPE